MIGFEFPFHKSWGKTSKQKMNKFPKILQFEDKMQKKKNLQRVLARDMTDSG